MLSMSSFADASGGMLMKHNHQSDTNSGDASGVVDNNSDARGNIARLTARARQLLVNGTDTRVVRNGLSTYEMSRKTAADVCARARATGQTSSSQASVELFMASLGFNLQEQLRLLQQLQATQVSLAGSAVVEAGGAIWNSVGSDELGSVLEVFVANRRNEVMQRGVEEIHQRVGEMMHERTEAMIRASWERCSVEVADVFETASLKNDANNSICTSGNAGPFLERHQTKVLSGSSMSRSNSSTTPLHSRAGVSALLSGRDVVSTKVLSKVAAFAQIVGTKPASQWVRYFAEHTLEDSPVITDEIVLLWKTIQRVVEPVTQQGSGRTEMTLVASSRHVMEQKAHAMVLSKTLNVEPDRLSDLENIHATRFVGIVERYTSSSNVWAHIFTAMRCGRYDAASIIAGSAGHRAVEAKLDEYAKTHFTQHCSLSAAAEMTALYNEEATRLDPYRQIVLFLLLVGKTGESDEVVQSTVASLSSKVARSLEDTLWIRLFCVRRVGAQGDKIQALVQMQRLLLDDMQELVALVHGNVVRLASLMIHALLVSSGVRLLTENDSTYVDGVHVAMCFHNAQLLHVSEVEVPLDIRRIIQQYCTIVLLDVDKRYSRASNAGTAIFQYFYRTELVDAFVNYCGNEFVCARLFGQRAGAGHVDGLLLQQGGVLTRELIEAMERIAEAAAANGRTELAVHVFLILEKALSLASDDTRASYALSRAVQIICPALSQAFHQQLTSESTSLFTHAVYLQERLTHSKCSIPHSMAECFQTLCAMSDVYVNVMRGETEQATRGFCNLSFVPTSVDDVERCATVFDSVSDCVATAAPPIIVMVSRSILLKAKKSMHDGRGDVLPLRRQISKIAAWVRRWRRHANRSLSDELSFMEQQINI
ncbi:dipeptidyl-peptidase 8-like serine peptidase [Trypanosoma vivax]|nr:dipeptidyl-peptidase 8-like serine peptidase [Trypanosoma vivax]